MEEEKGELCMDPAITDRHFRFLDWFDIDNACLSLYSQMKANNYAPDCIIALLRGGVIPARILADYFGISIDFFAIDVKLYDKIGVQKEEPIIKYLFKKSELKGNILVVDDIFESGKTMNAVLDQLIGKNVTTATLFWKETATQKPNYYAEVAKEKEWIVFVWEMYEFKREVNEK